MSAKAARRRAAKSARHMTSSDARTARRQYLSARRSERWSQRFVSFLEWVSAVIDYTELQRKLNAATDAATRAISAQCDENTTVIVMSSLVPQRPARNGATP